MLKKLLMFCRLILIISLFLVIILFDVPVSLANNETSILFVGDMMLSRDVERVVRTKRDYEWPFRQIRPVLDNADFVVGNLETPLIAGRALVGRPMVFRADTQYAAALVKNGFNAVDLANNHGGDQGQLGYKSTLQSLQKSNLPYFGISEFNKKNNLATSTVNDVRLAFLGYVDASLIPKNYQAGSGRTGVNVINLEIIKKDVIAAKKNSDLVIVNIHAGTEYTEKLTKLQKDAAHAAVDAGADLVIGHHPHVVQRVEEYKGRYIFYSLGNFVFDQSWSQATREGLAVKVLVDQKKIVGFELTPVFINSQYQSTLANSITSKRIISRVRAEKLPMIKWVEVK